MKFIFLCNNLLLIIRRSHFFSIVKIRFLLLFGIQNSFSNLNFERRRKNENFYWKKLNFLLIQKFTFSWEKIFHFFFDTVIQVSSYWIHTDTTDVFFSTVVLTYSKHLYVSLVPSFLF